MATMHPWLDLSQHDARLRLIAMQINPEKTVLLLIGGEHYPVAIEELGFQRSAQGYFYLNDATIKKEQVAILRKHFPEMAVTEMPSSEITMSPTRAREIMAAMKRQAERAQTVTDADIDAALGGDEPQAQSQAEATEASSSEPVINQPDPEDLLQVPYKARSTVSKSNVKVPRNLEAATQRALDRLEQRVGNIDDYVANNLGEDKAAMAQYLDAEQIDSVAMAIDAGERGRGFILGDAAGLGKGRTLSAYMKANILKGRKVLFLTEKANLLSDIYRDLRAVQAAEHVELLVPNSTVAINDHITGEVLYQADSKDISRMMRARAFDANFNLVATTYSQVRAQMGRTNPLVGEKANRMDLLEDYVRDAVLVLDEADVAAGMNSNTHANIRRLCQAAGSVVFSSATSIRDPKAIALFNEVLPEGLGSTTIANVLQDAGEAAQEALSEQLCDDGVMIVREHDYDGMVLEFYQDETRKPRNRDLSDRLSEILSAMNFLSGDIRGVIDTRNKELMDSLEQAEAARIAKLAGAAKFNKKSVRDKHGKLATTYTHFGSRLYNLNRSFLMSLSLDTAVEQALADIAAGKKPIMVIDKTMGSLLVEPFKARDEEPGEDDMFEALFDNEESDEIPTFRIVLQKVLDKVCVVNEKKGNQTIPVDLSQSDIAFANAKAEIAKLIEAFPDVNMTPIDKIHEELENAGYKGDEITGRSLKVEKDELGIARIVKRPAPDRNEVIRKFNAGSSEEGGLDYLIINKAGASGASMHAGKEFKDQRPRMMTFIQMPDTANSLKQFFGRTWRKDKVDGEIPGYRVLDAGLPINTYYSASVDNKMRQMSACTTSNRQNGMVSDAPDVLNKFGNQLAKEFLQEHTAVAENLMIAVKEDDTFDSTNYIRMLLGRVQLMGIKDAEKVIRDLNGMYYQRLDELALIGINPVKTKHYDWQAETVGKKLFRGSENINNATVFDDPVYMKEIRYREMIYPLKAMEVNRALKRSQRAMANNSAIFNDETLAGLREFVSLNKVNIASKRLHIGQTTLAQAIEDEFNNPAKSLYKNMSFLEETLEDFAPGKFIVMSDIMGDPQECVITGFKFKGESINDDESNTRWGRAYHRGEDYGRIGSYEIDVAMPGESRLYTYSLSSVRSDKNFKLTGKEYNPERDGIIFDKIQNGEREVVRTVLDGNIYQATLLAAQYGSVATYTDAEGVSRRGVILPDDIPESHLENLPQPIRHVDTLIDALIIQAATPHISMNKQKEILTTLFSARADNSSMKHKRRTHAVDFTVKLDSNSPLKEPIYDFRLPKTKKRNAENYDKSNAIFKRFGMENDRLESMGLSPVHKFTPSTSRVQGSIVTKDKALAMATARDLQAHGHTFYISNRAFEGYMNQRDNFKNMRYTEFLTHAEEEAKADYVAKRIELMQKESAQKREAAKLAEENASTIMKKTA